MEARQTGKGCFLDFSQREVASFTIGEEILAAAADPARRLGPSGNEQEGVRAAGHLSLPRRTLDRRHPGRTRHRPSSRSAPRMTATTPSPNCWRKGIAAAPCNDGKDLLATRRWPARP